MARADKVWVVTQLDRPIAAFTVKHELKTWLTNRPPLSAGVRIIRMQDGGREPFKNYQLTPEDL